MALATCLSLPEPDRDETLLRDALVARGVDAEVVAWNGPDQRPRDAWVLRSTWDYHHDSDGFLRWCAGVALRGSLWNPFHLVRWNLKKTYLRELKERGVPVVPTAWITRGQREPLDLIAMTHGWDDIVIKPQTSAASHLCRRFAGPPWDGAEAFIDRVLLERDVMVQGYLPDVEGRGERAIVWIDGVITHAVRKSPRLHGEHEETSDAVAVDPDEAVLAEVVLRPYASRLLYARVDVVRDGRGVPMVMELELIEPSLFLAQSERALTRLADGITSRLSASSPD